MWFFVHKSFSMCYNQIAPYSYGAEQIFNEVYKSMKDYAVYICVAIAVLVIGTIIAFIVKKRKISTETQVQTDNRQAGASTERDPQVFEFSYY